jgi:hypothetical protein
MAMNAMFFPIVLIPHSAKRILSISHRFHMCWIDAIAYAQYQERCRGGIFLERQGY